MGNNIYLSNNLLSANAIGSNSSDQSSPKGQGLYQLVADITRTKVDTQEISTETYYPILCILQETNTSNSKYGLYQNGAILTTFDIPTNYYDKNSLYNIETMFNNALGANEYNGIYQGFDEQIHYISVNEILVNAMCKFYNNDYFENSVIKSLRIQPIEAENSYKLTGYSPFYDGDATGTNTVSDYVKNCRTIFVKATGK